MISLDSPFPPPHYYYPTSLPWGQWTLVDLSVNMEVSKEGHCTNSHYAGDTGRDGAGPALPMEDVCCFVLNQCNINSTIWFNKLLFSSTC